MNNRFPRRTQLLAGASAVFTLLGSTTHAQTVDASATRSAVNRQASTAPVSVDTDRASVAAQVGTVRDGDVTVSDNSILASARGSVADTSLDGDDPAAAATPTSSSLSIAGRHTTADADMLVANSQAMTDAPVQSLAERSVIGIDSDVLSSATLGVAGNTLEASALGNQATNTLSLTRGNAGGAVVSLQSGDAGSGVSALDTDSARLSVAAASDSELELSGNTAGADAIGNRVDDLLSVDAGSVRVGGSSAPASQVPTATSDAATVNALYADLGSQTMAGKVAATAGIVPGNVALDVPGVLTGTRATVRDNTLSANATANRSAHALELQAGSVAGDAAAGGPTTLANVTNVQHDDGGDLVGATNGGTSVDIGGALSDSTLDVSDNAQSATATANRATGNLLTVDATAINTAEPIGLAQGAVGTAMTGADGTASTTAALSVQNVQETSGNSVIATMTANRVGLDLGGPVEGSTVAATANTADSAATANSAVNGVTVGGGTIRTSVDLNNSQTVDGQLRSNVGDGADRAGVTIVPAGGVATSSLRVADNEVSGVSVGNQASNSLAVTAATLGNGSGHDDAVAGPLDEGYGAAADIALSNYQKLGQPAVAGATSSGLATTVAGAFGIGGDGPLRTSALDVSGNSQSATSVGNTAVDRVSLDAATVPVAAAPAAGTALTSAQFGEGTVDATSDMQLIGRAGLGDASLSMTGNTNEAVAATNDADNGLAISATQIGAVSAGPAHAEVGNLGTATITGDHVLSNEQFASGNVAATARTTFLDADGGAGMAGARFGLSDNSAVADVSANHAINAVSVAGASAFGADAGLASSQMNAAAVAANADFEATPPLTGIGTPSVASTVAIDGNLSQAVGRGNNADNAVTVSATGGAPVGTGSTAVLSAFETDAAAPALLVNGQSNYGVITARATGAFGIPLNASAAVLSSTLGVTGNSAVASAYGNSASNKLMLGGAGAAPAAMLVNVQSNNAAVTASVIGSTTGLRSGMLASSTIAVTGNQLAATAVGNIATNAISAVR